MAIVTKSFGGQNPVNRDGGSPFFVERIKSFGMRTGDVVDALILNGVRYGGGGGTDTLQRELSRDEYINKVIVGSGWNVDFLELQTNKGRTIRGGGSGGRRSEINNIRVLGIGGRAGNVLDKISIRYIEDFDEPELIDPGQLAVINIVPPGEIIEEFVSTEVSTLVAITRVWELVFGRADGASIEAPLDAFTAKVMSETNIKATTREEIRTEIKTTAARSQKRNYSPPPGFAGIEVVSVDVYKDSSGIVWFFPSSAPRRISVPLDSGIDSNVEVYDLTKALAMQMPSMASRRGTRHRYDFYRTPSFIQMVPAERLRFLYGRTEVFSGL